MGSQLVFAEQFSMYRVITFNVFQVLFTLKCSWCQGIWLGSSRSARATWERTTRYSDEHLWQARRTTKPRAASHRHKVPVPMQPTRRGASHTAVGCRTERAIATADSAETTVTGIGNGLDGPLI